MAFPLNREQTALSVVRPEHPPAHNHALIGYTTRRDTIYNCPAYTRGEVVLGFIGQAKIVVISVDLGACDFASNGKRLAGATAALEADLLPQKQ